MNSQKKYQLHPAMQLLYKAIQRERNTKLVLAMALMVAGTISPYLYFQENNFMTAAGLVALLIGLRLMFSVIRSSQTDGGQLWALICDKPGQIVWVYSITTQNMPFGFHLWDVGTMYFKMLDGNEISINLPVKKLRMVSKFLNRRLPHASFGYSSQLKDMFEADPSLLLKQ